MEIEGEIVERFKTSLTRRSASGIKIDKSACTGKEAGGSLIQVCWARKSSVHLHATLNPRSCWMEKEQVRGRLRIELPGFRLDQGHTVPPHHFRGGSHTSRAAGR